MTPISVVVCDDVPELRQLARIVLEEGGEICIFSGFEEGKVADVALRLKANRYVCKGAPLEELRNAVRELAA